MPGVTPNAPGLVLELAMRPEVYELAQTITCCFQVVVDLGTMIISEFVRRISIVPRFPLSSFR
jgi:hypothetical protein